VTLLSLPPGTSPVSRGDEFIPAHVNSQRCV